MLPPLTPLNDRDNELLDALRLSRFRAEFAKLLLTATLYLSGTGADAKNNGAGFVDNLVTPTDNSSGIKPAPLFSGQYSKDRTLAISGGKDMTALLHSVPQIEREAWLTAAATTISIYACSELIYKGSCNKLELKARGERMATATQEQDLTQVDVENGIEPPPLTQESRIVRSMALADIAVDLEADTTALQTFLESQNARLIRFGETLLVLETDAASAYEHYSVIRARQKMQERFALKGAAIEEKPQVKATKNTAPKESSKPKKPTLTFKKQFKVNHSNYKRTVQNFLNAMFPDNEAEQKKALSDILQPNEIGGAYLEKIVRAGDYKDKQHARDLLYKAAALLQSASDNAAPKEQEVETINRA